MSKAEIGYIESKEIHLDIKNRFADIEEFSSEDEKYKIEGLIEDAKKLVNKINRINKKDLEFIYTPEIVDILNSNLETFKDDALYIIKFLISAQIYEKLFDPLKELISQVRYGTDEQIKDATQRLAGFVTKPVNIDQHKSSINAVINGNMNITRFRKWYSSVQHLMPRGQKQKSNRPEPISKQMGNWPFKEGFIPLKKFIQIINE